MTSQRVTALKQPPISGLNGTRRLRRLRFVGQFRLVCSTRAHSTASFSPKTRLEYISPRRGNNGKHHWWLPLHIALLGTVTQAIVGGQLLFSATLGLARGPARSMTVFQLKLLNVAALWIIIGRLIDFETLFIAGVSIFVGAIGWVTWHVHRMWRSSVNRRFALPARSTVSQRSVSFSVPRSVALSAQESSTKRRPTPLTAASI
jgi:NADH:ubiquinone oxidoreductase subunit 6 (subunit J)